ncbi:predicted acetyltransferase [Ureibacillus xyleni]|uniref:Predicted acetyltransferase n=1 Tax=Ureibacillus xyleni TaxID=614648 RepID=A0A285T3L3_9BACL|nr:GNAT family N-acetyltransferase [Ureibacillus xyleni]SOC15645.1 predicted acetyltransferase [Ureibacillus xyleni]
MQLMKAAEMKNAFVSLFNIYAHELSKYNSWIGTQINHDGNYLAEHVEQYFTDSTIEAFCITEDDRPIGFVVFSNSETNQKVCSIEEIFLIETSRRNGFAEKICKDFWEQNQGICVLHVLKANLPALSYWDKLIQKCGYEYKKKSDNEQMLRYEIML